MLASGNLQAPGNIEALTLRSWYGLTQTVTETILEEDAGWESPGKKELSLSKEMKQRELLPPTKPTMGMDS